MFFSNALKSSKKATPIIDVIISVANITQKRIFSALDKSISILNDEMLLFNLKENNVKIKDGIDVNSIMREFQDRDIVQQHQLKYLTVSYEKSQN